MDFRLETYYEQIYDDQDKPLFDDAIKSFNAGAKRGAYILIWLSCAESIKRKFYEAKKRDNRAGNIVGEIETREKNYQSIDKLVLEKALNYGLISNSDYRSLFYIYEMRCIYGHPYEEEPSDEEVIHAADTTVKYILSQPVKLREGFAQQLLERMLSEQNFLDNTNKAVARFAKEILPRIDEKIYNWFLKKIFMETEKISDDPTMELFLRRLQFFAKAIILYANSDILSYEEWHELVTIYPNFSIKVLATPTIFKNIGVKAQDSIVGNIITMSKDNPTLLNLLEVLQEEKSLTPRHINRFNDCIDELKIAQLSSAKISTYTIINKLIKELQFRNWYRQNPAAEIVLNNGPEEVESISEDTQIDLGRNIYQAAEGGANSCINFLSHLSESSHWPINFLKGIVFESIINEDYRIRFKNRNFIFIIHILNALDPDSRHKVIDHTCELIGKANSEQLDFDEDDLEKFKSYKDECILLEPLYTKLSEKI